MLDTTIALTVLIGCMIAALLGYLFYLQRKAKVEEQQKVQGSQQLQLQAYERLTLLVERIALPNLISRLSQSELSARDMQHLLTHNIREEFEYNINNDSFSNHDFDLLFFHFKNNCL